MVLQTPFSLNDTLILTGAHSSVLGGWVGLTEEARASIEDLDIEFENMSVKVITNRVFPQIKMADGFVGPADEGKELEVRHWVARELIRAGLVRPRDEEILDIRALTKVHWREMIQTGRQISTLPENFYPKLRRYLEFLKERASSDSAASQEYDRAIRLAYDIRDCRLRKIVTLAAAPAQTENVLKSLSGEERFLYDSIFALVSSWKLKILKR